MGFAHKKHRLKTRCLTRLNFNKTRVSNLYKLMTVLKPEIYTNKLLPSKKFSCQSLKKCSLLIANCLIDLFQKLNKNQKSSTLKIREELFM